jgi:hypothetical protein
MRLVSGLFDVAWRFTSMVTMVWFWRVLVSSDSHCFFCRVLGYDTFFLHMFLPSRTRRTVTEILLFYSYIIWSPIL